MVWITNPHNGFPSHYLFWGKESGEGREKERLWANSFDKSFLCPISIDIKIEFSSFLLGEISWGY
tara:strand:+ start:96 stop:290 length:195 start_codon:yes stop_codon:yes gene_type:complete